MLRMLKPKPRDLRRVVHGLFCGIFAAFTLLAFWSVGTAQIPDDVVPAPPPLKMIPKETREILDKQPGVKERTKLALQLMESRIVAAEAANTSDELDKTFAELGIFHALMDDTMSFLGANKRPSGKILDNLKRFELGLRKFTPRLELIRREMPITHEVYIKSLLRQLRDARTKATEPLFGNSVVSNL